MKLNTNLFTVLTNLNTFNASKSWSVDGGCFWVATGLLQSKPRNQKYQKDFCLIDTLTILRQNFALTTEKYAFRVLCFVFLRVDHQQM
jgi:hypothetical protein